MGILAPAAPPRWVSELADSVLESFAAGRYFEAQDAVKAAAKREGLEPMVVAQRVAGEWDRWGVVRGDYRRLVTGL